MPEFRQTSFASGELAPTMWGRTDLSAYEHGLRRCHNFVIDQHGAASMRPGFRHITECAPGTTAKLFGLVVSNTESYLLVFTSSRVRIHPSGGANYTELQTNYTASEISRLRFQQLGRGVLVFCPGKPIQEIRGSGSTWTISTFHTDPQLSSDPKLSPVWGFIGTERPETDEAKEGYIYAFTTVLFHVESQTYVETKPEYVIHQGWGEEHPDRASRDADGNLTWPDGNPWLGRGNRINNIDVEKYPIRHVYIPPYPGYTTPDGFEHHAFRIYRAVKGSRFDDHESAWGLVGESQDDPRGSNYIKIEFPHFGDADYAVPPRQIRGGLWDILTWRRGAVVGDDSVQHNPTVGAIHDQRLVLAASERAPDKIWFSQVNSYDNFDLYPLPAAHHAVTAVLGSKSLENIRALVSHHKLLVLTDMNVWSVDGAGDSAVSVGNIVARVHSEVGAAPIEPIVYGPDVFFVGSDRRRIFRASYDGRTRMYVADELSALSSHLFKGDFLSAIRSWSASREPYHVTWIAKEDGTFATMSYAPESEVLGFAGHTTGQDDEGQDRVLDFATLRVSGEERVFAVVRRRVGGSLTMFLESVDTNHHLDAFKTYSRTVSIIRSILITDLAHLNGRKVMVTASAAGAEGRRVALGPYLVQNGRLEFELPTLPGEQPGTVANVNLAVGLPYTAELELLDFPLEKLRVKTISKVGWEVLGSRGLLTGEDFDNLTEWLQSTIADVYGPSPSTGLAEVYISSTWNTHGRAVLRQPLPLPLTVLGVTRRGTLGG